MKAIQAATLAALTLSGAAEAATMEDCAKIDSDLDRLGCYDEASGREPATRSAKSPSSAWRLATETSPLTDERNVFLTVESDEPVRCNWNQNDHVQLHVRCVENRTAILFATPCHMTSSDYNDYGHVEVRLDRDKAMTWRMDESTNNRALGLWNGGQSIPQIKKMFGKSRMIARMTPFNQNAFTVSFDISGLEEAMGPLREACHW